MIAVINGSGTNAPVSICSASGEGKYDIQIPPGVSVVPGVCVPLNPYEFDPHFFSNNSDDPQQIKQTVF